jgi:hypothetical protein
MTAQRFQSWSFVRRIRLIAVAVTIGLCFSATQRSSAADPSSALELFETKIRPMLVEEDKPFEPYVFLRGQQGNHGPRVPRQFLTVVAGPDRKPFANRSGRLELAQAIASPTNPLTARVIVNRVWMLHFGAPLVRTPSDFSCCARSTLPVPTRIRPRAS